AGAGGIRALGSGHPVQRNHPLIALPVFTLPGNHAEMAGLFCLYGPAPQDQTETAMTEIEFNALAAQGYNRIPIIAETYADLDTPLGIYLKLAHSGPEGGRNTCLLESVVGGERFGRYSFIGLPSKTVLRTHGSITEVVHMGKVIETHEG